MSRGIVNPWKKAPPPPADGTARPRGEIRYEHEVPISSGMSDTVGFDGQAYTIYVETLPRKGVAPDVIAKALLGALVADLFKQVPLCDNYFRTASLFRDHPLGPAVALEFGGLTLYATASSTDGLLAVRMAVDRLAMCFSEIKARLHTIKPLFEAYHVSIARKA